MHFENLLLEKQQAAGIITINRPDKLNALNKQTMLELSRALDYFYDDTSISGLIITGSGEKAFVAGADIREFQDLTPDEAKQFAEKGQDIFFKIENYHVPVIALVNGFALGGGCELALACHMRVATANAKFGQPEVNLGLIPGYGGTQRLTQLIGKGKAIELMLTADMVNAEEAYRLNLVNYVEADKHAALERSLGIIQKVSTKAPVAVAQVIAATNAAHIITGYAIEANGFGIVCRTEDFREGTQAFLEKRTANFTGK
jgi:enoyl-CoA hydratase